MMFGNLYLGNKMVGIPEFNFPWFDMAAGRLMAIPGIDYVFNPAHEDRKMGFDATGLLGTDEEMAEHNFDRRKALALDWGWIAAKSNGMIVGPDWRNSTGTISEVACHQALGLPVWPFEVFAANWDYPDLPLLTLKPFREYL